MGMFSLVLLSTSLGLTLGLIAGGILRLVGLASPDVFWLIVQACSGIGLAAGAIVVLRIRFQQDTNRPNKAKDH